MLHLFGYQIICSAVQIKRFLFRTVDDRRSYIEWIRTRIQVACHTVRPSIAKPKSHRKHQCRRFIQTTLIIMHRLDSVRIRQVAEALFDRRRIWTKSTGTYRCQIAWRCEWIRAMSYSHYSLYFIYLRRKSMHFNCIMDVVLLHIFPF